MSHHHYIPENDIKLTQDDQLLHDTTHLKEDMGSMADELDFSKMTEQEIEFHYFQYVRNRLVCPRFLSNLCITIFS